MMRASCCKTKTMSVRKAAGRAAKAAVIALAAAMGGVGSFIEEEKGSIAMFTVGKPVPNMTEVKQTGANEHRWVGSDKLDITVFTEGGDGVVSRIRACQKGMFTQRYISIGESRMKDVLDRYGKAQISRGAEIELEYDRVVFVFDNSPQDKTPPLERPLRCVVLRQRVPVKPGFMSVQQAPLASRVPAEVKAAPPPAAKPAPPKGSTTVSPQRAPKRQTPGC